MDVVNLTGVSLAFVAAIIVLSVSLIVSPASASTNADDARSLLSEGIISYLSGGEGVATISDLRAAATLYPAYPRRITDTAGTAFIFYRPVERIIAMHPHAADAAIVLGVDRKIVGVTDTIRSKTLRFPELSKVTGIGRWTEPDVEAILALNPDLILTYVDYPEPEKLEDHLSGRIPVVRMDFYRAEVFREEMEMVGRIFDEQENLDEYLEWYDTNLALVEGRVSTIPYGERVLVYGESGSGQAFGRRAFGEKTGLHDLITAAGGVNVAAGHITGYADVENEWIIQQNPDIILIWSGKGGYKLGDRDEIVSLHDDIMGMPGFERIKAVRDGRVFIITSGFAYGPSSPVALVQVASWLYPDLFEDIDPAAIHAEFLERFTHTGEEVREMGTFYYPDVRAE
jgi:iron complex transport system substrate-binding protein